METANKLLCPNCFSPVNDDAVFCSKCKVEFYNCSNCSSLVLETDTICKNCNSDLYQEEIHKPVEKILNRKPMYEFKPLGTFTIVLVILLFAGIFFFNY